MDHLDFEKPIVELEMRLGELRVASNAVTNGDSEMGSEIGRLQKKLDKLLEQTFSNLTPWQIVQLARHPARPHTRDYIDALFSDFEPLHGDRQYADDHAIIAGVGQFLGRPVAVVGHEKGGDTDSRIKHNFGMPRPEGYRKAMRIFKLAERFGMPILTFIDTPGAYPGIDAEERNQSGAIAESLKMMPGLRVPVICTVIGEGGSGGALAVGVGDRLFMLQYATYSVISPEGCASILWKSGDKAAHAAEAMCITAPRLLELGLIDQIIPEPPGGAHRDVEQACANLRVALDGALGNLCAEPAEELVRQRYEKIARTGALAAT